jgi:hypothetical protein
MCQYFFKKSVCKVMSNYRPKPFTKEIADQMKANMNSEFDEKRTLCNVLKLAYRCSREESFNLEATRALLLEALWMGQRMSDALTKKRKENIEKELIQQKKDEDPFAVDWDNMDGRNVAQGNWD